MIASARVNKSAIVFLGLVALALTGCGGGEPTHGTGPRGIFTSTNDCAEHEKFEFKSCSEAIRTAIKIHNEESAIYENVRYCKAKEPSCERTLNNKFRPRLLGFYVELPEKEEDAIIGRPLYALVDDTKGFRDNKKVSYTEKDLSLHFSRSSVAAYKAHSVAKVSGGFGT